MISTNAKTVTAYPLAEDGTRLELSMPAAPYRLPHKDGGYLILMGYEGDSGGCSATPANPSCGCGSCFTGSKKASASSGSKQNRMIERFEIIKYSGYAEDGLTLIVTDRGVESTRKQNWEAGTVVLQTITGQEIKDINDRLTALEAFH